MLKSHSDPQAASAVVIGASGGFGGALEQALLDEGAFAVVLGLARSRVGSQQIDLLDEASIAAAAGEVGRGSPPTLVIVANGLLHSDGRKPEKSLRRLPGRIVDEPETHV